MAYFDPTEQTILLTEASFNEGLAADDEEAARRKANKEIGVITLRLHFGKATEKE